MGRPLSRAHFPIATTQRCRGEHYSFPRITPFTLDPYLIMLSVKQGGIKYHFFEVFGITRPGIEPWSPKPFVNTNHYIYITHIHTHTIECTHNRHYYVCHLCRNLQLPFKKKKSIFPWKHLRVRTHTHLTRCQCSKSSKQLTKKIPPKKNHI